MHREGTDPTGGTIAVMVADRGAVGGCERKCNVGKGL